MPAYVARGWTLVAIHVFLLCPSGVMCPHVHSSSHYDLLHGTTERREEGKKKKKKNWFGICKTGNVLFNHSAHTGNSALSSWHPGFSTIQTYTALFVAPKRHLCGYWGLDERWLVWIKQAASGWLKMSPNLSQHAYRRLEASGAQKACWTSSEFNQWSIQLTKQLLEGDISRMGPSLERKEKREERWSVC